jgi:hypothetical protein
MGGGGNLFFKCKLLLIAKDFKNCGNNNDVKSYRNINKININKY